MAAGFMTKQLQGEKSQQFRNDILNIKRGEYCIHAIYIYILLYEYMLNWCEPCVTGKYHC